MLNRLAPPLKRVILVAFIAIGAVLTFHFFYRCWRLVAGAGYPAWAMVLFAVSMAGAVIQPFFVWYLYLHFRRRRVRQPAPGLSVDVFVTAYDEDPKLVESTLRAALAVTYPHRTWLLDDSRDGRYGANRDARWLQAPDAR
jgi:cellulose synthase (UDP-forming)